MILPTAQFSVHATSCSMQYASHDMNVGRAHQCTKLDRIHFEPGPKTHKQPFNLMANIIRIITYYYTHTATEKSRPDWRWHTVAPSANRLKAFMVRLYFPWPVQHENWKFRRRCVEQRWSGGATFEQSFSFHLRWKCPIKSNRKMKGIWFSSASLLWFFMTRFIA